MEITLESIQSSVALLLGMILIFSVYDTVLDYIKNRDTLSFYSSKIVKLINTGNEYVAIGYSLNLIGEGTIYLFDPKTFVFKLEVHPKEVTVLRELVLIER